MPNRKQKILRMLGVDPSPSLRAVLAQLAEECGIAVDLCVDLADVRRHLESSAYDLVVTAAELPDGGYTDVLVSVRAREDMALAPVILLVAGRNENAVQEALDKGMTEVFFKRDFDDLARYLEKFAPAVSSAANSSAGTPRALVVEDDRALGAYCKELLGHYGFGVDHVPSGEAALWEAERRRYDFILVDLVLGGSCSGTQFLRRLRDPALASSQAVAIAMSSYGDEARRIEALRAGANAFIAKPIEEREIEALIRGMAQRPPAESSRDVAPRADLDKSSCTRCRPCKLTPRESNICALVAAGYSDKRIAEEMGVSYWTVRTHIAHAFKKCEVSNRVELVRRIQGN